MSDTEEAAPAAEDTIVLDEPIVECIAALSARSSDREATGAAIKTLATKVGALSAGGRVVVTCSCVLWVV